mmetsp:Transcript_44742/g.106187  ORF Transcript_44742/g.106187 Transcript_44742/m.106187 type:complete len:235 (+) Transcript_44742:859-1563(+)
MVWLSQTEAAYDVTGGESGQESVLLLLGAEGVDGVHDQRALHRQSGAIGRVNALNLTRDQAISCRRCTCTTITFDEGAEQPSLPELFEQVFVEVLLAKASLNNGHQDRVAELPGRVSNQDLLFVQLPLQVQHVSPMPLRVPFKGIGARFHLWRSSRRTNVLGSANALQVERCWWCVMLTSNLLGGQGALPMHPCRGQALPHSWLRCNCCAGLSQYGTHAGPAPRPATAILDESI